MLTFNVWTKTNIDTFLKTSACVLQKSVKHIRNMMETKWWQNNIDPLLSAETTEALKQSSQSIIVCDFTLWLE